MYETRAELVNGEIINDLLDLCNKQFISPFIGGSCIFCGTTMDNEGRSRHSAADCPVEHYRDLIERHSPDIMKKKESRTHDRPKGMGCEICLQRDRAGESMDNISAFFFMKERVPHMMNVIEELLTWCIEEDRKLMWRGDLRRCRKEHESIMGRRGSERYGRVRVAEE